MTAAVLTISDSAAGGQRSDVSGPAVKAALERHKFRVIATQVIADEQASIQEAILEMASRAQLVVTTGGTGITERDVTPEATRAVCSRLVEGVAERMRAVGGENTPLAALSRAVCGICGNALVLNLPGSPQAATESLAAVLSLLPHALDLLAGKTAHSQH
jgi:molybdenum cofactor synthesis domain-containing protein